GDVMEAVGTAVAVTEASQGSGSCSREAAPWLLLPPARGALGGRTGSGRRTPPAKSSSAQEGEAAGLASSGQNSNSGEEDALLLLLLLTPDASMAGDRSG